MRREVVELAQFYLGEGGEGQEEMGEERGKKEEGGVGNDLEEELRILR